jgi:hypothetical protein
VDVAREARGGEECAAQRDEEGAGEHFGGIIGVAEGAGGYRGSLVMALMVEMYAKDARALRGCL